MARGQHMTWTSLAQWSPGTQGFNVHRTEVQVPHGWIVNGYKLYDRILRQIGGVWDNLAAGLDAGAGDDYDWLLYIATDKVVSDDPGDVDAMEAVLTKGQRAYTRLQKAKDLKGFTLAIKAMPKPWYHAWDNRDDYLVGFDEYGHGWMRKGGSRLFNNVLRGKVAVGVSPSRVAARHLARNPDLRRGDALVADGHLPYPGGWIKPGEVLTFDKIKGDQIMARYKGKNVSFNMEYLDAGTLHKRAAQDTPRTARAPTGSYALFEDGPEDVPGAVAVDEGWAAGRPGQDYEIIGSDRLDEADFVFYKGMTKVRGGQIDDIASVATMLNALWDEG